MFAVGDSDDLEGCHRLVLVLLLGARRGENDMVV